MGSYTGHIHKWILCHCLPYIWPSPSFQCCITEIFSSRIFVFAPYLVHTILCAITRFAGSCCLAYSHLQVLIASVVRKKKRETVYLHGVTRLNVNHSYLTGVTMHSLFTLWPLILTRKNSEMTRCQITAWVQQRSRLLKIEGARKTHNENTQHVLMQLHTFRNGACLSLIACSSAEIPM